MYAPIGVILVTIILTYVTLRIYNGLKGPLASIPGPTFSKFTDLSLKLSTLLQNRATYVHDLHQNYGPVVRLAPNEISISDVQATKTIYKAGSPFLKSKWYQSFTEVAGVQSLILFAMSDPQEHSQLRKQLSHGFSEKWIKNLEPYMARNIRLAVERMAEEADASGFVDVNEWFDFMATDVVGEAAFGDSFHMLQTGQRNQYINDIKSVMLRGAIRSEFPRLASILKHLPFGFFKEADAATARNLQYGSESIRRYFDMLSQDPNKVKPTLLTKLYAAHEQGHDIDLEHNAEGFIVAGTDTTTSAATYMIWELANHPEIEQDVISAVSRLPADFNDEKLRALPILDNVINETLRLHSPVSQGLPRVVPTNGAVLCNHAVPGGCIVSAQAWTLHRDPAVWPDPLEFNPSRWIKPTKEMKDAFFAWGAGARICIGIHFAMVELRYALADFYRKFDRGVKPWYTTDFTEKDMGHAFVFVAPPKGHKCYVASRD